MEDPDGWAELSELVHLAGLGGGDAKRLAKRKLAALVSSSVKLKKT
jgi:hypothetical protein